MSDILALAPYARSLARLHELWTPHPGQIAPGHALFHEGSKRIFLSLGRRFGKSTLMSYMAVRWALSHPRSCCYLVGPYLKQAREIFLATGSLLQLCPPEISTVNMTDSRVTFDNGSFVRVIGADDPDAVRGIKVSALFCDEIKDFKPAFIDSLSPALVDEDGPLILSGTPPDVAEHPYWDLVNTAKTDPEWSYFHGTSYDNPHLKKAVLDRERAKYEARGDSDVFMREYMAQFVPGGKRAVFGMFDDRTHIRPYEELLAQINRNRKQWQFYCTLDPGSASVFAVTLSAINPYKGQMIVLDEVYATTQSETTVGKMWPRVAAKMAEIHEPDADADDQWIVTVDEAATWARNEILDQFGVASFATEKARHRKGDGIGLLKDMLLKNRVTFSDRMVDTIKEMKGYMLDKQGNFIKANDHAIDTLRYTLGTSRFSFNEFDYRTPEALPVDEQKRAYTVKDDMLASFDNFGELYLSDYDDAEFY